ncbi:MAG: hypothetical protein H0U66_06585 [Gemmatimonadaceae bacterium]|nr:hypothetical protein [Gemmatimonadaceae bacterium]
MKTPDVVLTEEEPRECDTHWRALFAPTEDGKVHIMRSEHIEPFMRSQAALCLMSRAQRFAFLADGQPEYRTKACEAAAKACALYPLSVNLYDFAMILEEFGEHEEASTLLREFIQHPKAVLTPQMDDIALSMRDITGMVARAKEMVSRLPPS